MTFLKSLLLGLKRRVGEPIMIILTVAIAVATFVSALSLRDSIERRAIASYRAFSGEAELEAAFSEDFSSYYLTADDAKYRTLSTESEKYGDLYAGYLFYASLGKEEGSFAEVYACDVSALDSYNPVVYLSGKGGSQRSGVVLRESFAEKIGARTGDILIATRYGSAQKLTLTVTGIAKETGLFARVDALLSEEGAARLLSLGDSVKVYNKFFLDLSDEKMNSLGVAREEVASRVHAACPAFDVGSPVRDRDVKITLSYQSTLLLVIAMIVAALGAVLIYNAVTLVMKTRLSIAALFKSVGATSGVLSLYLFAEILIYGVVGGLLGLLGSLGANAIFAALTASAATFGIGVGAAFLGVAFGVVLSFLSSLFPVLRLAYSPLQDMLRIHSPVARIRKLPAILASGGFLAFFLWTAFAGVSSAFTVGVFAFLFLLIFLFAVTPLAVKGVSESIRKITGGSPRAGKLYLAASGASSNRHAQSGARLLAIAITAVVAVAVLLGEASSQLSSFEGLFRADIMISASADELSEIAAEVRAEQGVSGAYLAYVETRCPIEGEEENTVSLLAARGQDFEEVFRAKEFGVDVSSVIGVRKAAMGGGLALKLGLSVGDEFALVVNGKRVAFTLSSLIDTPLTVVFTDLSGLGESNFCLVKGDADVYSRLSQKYALKGSVLYASDAFGYVTELATDYIRVFSFFEGLVFLFAAAGYVVAALASYRERRRERELLVATGASKGDVRTVTLCENAIVIGTAVFLGAALSVALLFVVQNMLKSLGLYFALIG